MIEPEILIVIATYNEIDNLPSLIDRLVALLPSAEILVIDDASPDGTGHWCDQAIASHPQLRVVHRVKKLGLGSATIIGFQTAIEREFPFVATMDADFSHDPTSLPQLWAALQSPEGQHYGVAIGSRYVHGGRIEGWPLRRQWVSRIVNFYSRCLLRLSTMDNSGAFRVYRTSALQRIQLDSIRSSGYGYLEEILWRLKRAGVDMIEIPITFRDRTVGQSKTSLREGIQVFWEITQLGIGRRN